ERMPNLIVCGLPGEFVSWQHLQACRISVSDDRLHALRAEARPNFCVAAIWPGIAQCCPLTAEMIAPVLNFEPKPPIKTGEGHELQSCRKPARYTAASAAEKSLPTAIRAAIAGSLAGSAVHIINARFRLAGVENGVIFLLRGPVRCAREGVFGNLFQVSGGNQIIKRLGRFLLVQCVLRDQRAQLEQVLFQHCLARVDDRAVIGGHRNGDQDQHNADHDHQLNQGKAAQPSPDFESCHYQSLYLVPSSAVPSDLVYTSKTLSPSQESESGSSCMERNPQSLFPVIGSIGILRRNFSFFPPTSTPFTSVSRSGG